MQNFIDSQTQKLWAFDADVVVSSEDGVYAFTTAAGVLLNTPQTLQPYTVTAPTAAQLASQALVQSAQSMLAAGLAIESTSTPGLNGTYACDVVSQMDVISVETSLNAGRGFPGGATTFNYPDAMGAMHAFSQGNFTDFAAAVRDYVYALKSVIAGASTLLPSASVTIA